MKKYVFLFMLLFLSVYSPAQSISAFRAEYRTANKDSAACAALYKKAMKAADDNLINGYKGAVTMMYAGFVKDKSEKLKLFKSGRSILEKSIQQDKENPELILLRYSIQSNAPKVLGYNKEMDSDKNLLLSKFDSITDKEVKKSIRSFLLESKHLSAAEKAALK